MLLAPRWRGPAVAALHFRRRRRGSKVGPTGGGAAAASCWCRWMRKPRARQITAATETKKRLAVPQVRVHAGAWQRQTVPQEKLQDDVSGSRNAVARQDDIKRAAPDEAESNQTILLFKFALAHIRPHIHIIHTGVSQSASALRLALLCRGRRGRPPWPSVRRRPQRTQRLLHHTRRRLEHLPHTHNISSTRPNYTQAGRPRGGWSGAVHGPGRST